MANVWVRFVLVVIAGAIMVGTGIALIMGVNV